MLSPVAHQYPEPQGDDSGRSQQKGQTTGAEHRNGQVPANVLYMQKDRPLRDWIPQYTKKGGLLCDRF